MYFKNCCNFVNVILNTLRFWLNNDNNDNIHAGGKFDAGGGAETSFLLTVALIPHTMLIIYNNGSSIKTSDLSELLFTLYLYSGPR